ncbi:MAG TPA: nitroreductase family deazaflavin-dependent oxidoreductase [Dehalococcoidia bacterium]|nr:nitroreductase family deazaflavin-dependent oxidoreductase [Dehalococcoidia bacterium]
MNERNRLIIEEFRANGGIISMRPPYGPVLLLHNKGARTGIERVTPLSYMRDGENYVIFASYGGFPRNPDWYHNLMGHLETTIEVGTEMFNVTAEEARGERRDALFARHVAGYPHFGEYQSKTERRIPVIVLKPRRA